MYFAITLDKQRMMSLCSAWNKQQMYQLLTQSHNLYILAAFFFY